MIYLHLYRCKIQDEEFEMANRIRRCADVKEFERAIDDYITTGYTVKSRGEENALLIKKEKKTKHFQVFLWTFWFTAGIGNLIYALMPAKIEDEVLVKIDR